MTSRETERWDEDHAKRCNGRPRAYVLGYEFSADALVLPVAKRLTPDDETQAFCRTLGTALVAGAAELLNWRRMKSHSSAIPSRTQVQPLLSTKPCLEALDTCPAWLVLEKSSRGSTPWSNFAD